MLMQSTTLVIIFRITLKMKSAVSQELSIGLIVAVVWYVRLPLERKKELQERIKANLKAIGQRLDIS